MPKRVDHESRRRELIEASWKVIARDGIEGASLRRVAAAAKCTTGRIAHYFSGRDELILSALRRANARAGARMAEIAHGDGSAAARLRRVVYEGLPLDAARLAEWRIWIAFWAAAAANDDLARENARRYRDWQALLSSLLEGIVSAGTANDSALALVSVVDGLGIRAALAPTPGNRRLATAAVDRWIAAL